MSTQSPANKKVLKFILFLIIFSACWYLGRIFKIDVASYQDFLSGLPLFLSGLIFVVLYVGTTTFIWFGPKDVLRVASAVFFGGPVSAIFVWLGEMINAVIMFYLSRVLGRKYVMQKLKSKAETIDQMKDNVSVWGILAWRINPLIPYRLVDLGYGLTNVHFKKYISVLAVPTFLRIFLFQLLIVVMNQSLLKNMKVIIAEFRNSPYDIQTRAMNLTIAVQELAVAFLKEHTLLILICFVYLIAVIAVTIAAVAMRCGKKRKEKKYG